MLLYATNAPSSLCAIQIYSKEKAWKACGLNIVVYIFPHTQRRKKRVYIG